MQTLTGSYNKNINRILKYIYYNKKPVTRQLISDSLSLSLPTISESIRELISDGTLRYSGMAGSTGGRKPREIEIVPESRIVIGVAVNRKKVYINAVDINGNILMGQKISIIFDNSNQYFDEINRRVNDFINENNLTNNIVGIGICLPGVIDYENDEIKFELEWLPKERKISDIIKCFDYKCLVSSSIFATAEAEGIMEKSNNLICYIEIGDRIKSALVSNGQVITHNRDIGLIGQIPLETSYRQKFSVLKADFEDYCSTKRLSTDFGITTEEFFQRLVLGDNDVMLVFSQYVENLSATLSIIHKVIQCRIVLGGEIVKYKNFFEERMENKLRKPYYQSGNIKFCNSCMDSATIGVAHMTIQNYFEML